MCECDPPWCCQRCGGGPNTTRECECDSESDEDEQEAQATPPTRVQQDEEMNDERTNCVARIHIILDTRD